MAGEVSKEEKTEEATPRRREESRELGQVAFSADLTGSLVLVAVAVTLLLAGKAVGGMNGRVLIEVLGRMRCFTIEDLEINDVLAIAKALMLALLPALATLLLPMLACGVIVAYSQAGFRIAPHAIALDLAKIDPLKGVARMFSLRSAVRLGYAAAKLVAVIASVVWVTIGELPRLNALAGSELRPALAAGAHVAGKSVATALVAILVLALADLFYQRFHHERDLRMSKIEIKREFRDTEGDPHVRARIRRIQRELAGRRMMADVPKATVVLTNPARTI